MKVRNHDHRAAGARHHTPPDPEVWFSCPLMGSISDLAVQSSRDLARSRRAVRRRA